MSKKTFRLAGLLPGLLLIIALNTNVYAQETLDSEYHLIAPLPNSLISNEGLTIDESGDWEDLRRDELLELFRTHVYGRVPQAKVSIEFEVQFQNKKALGGSAVMKEVEVRVSKGDRELNFTMLIFLPSEASEAVPLFLGLNFNGNHTVHLSEEISITESWVPNKPGIGLNLPCSREVRAILIKLKIPI